MPLRGEESQADQRFVEALCDRLGIPLHTRRVDTRARAAAHNETLEEAARNLRYEAFRALLSGRQATHILTAHTLDDQAETVLMKAPPRSLARRHLRYRSRHHPARRPNPPPPPVRPPR